MVSVFSIRVSWMCFADETMSNIEFDVCGKPWMAL